MSQQLYLQVVEITEEFLGPAAPRFVSRQIAFHLHKLPADLEDKDLPKLIEWGRVSLGFLTEDQHTVDEYAQKLQALVLNHA